MPRFEIELKLRLGSGLRDLRARLLAAGRREGAYLLSDVYYLSADIDLATIDLGRERAFRCRCLRDEESGEPPRVLLTAKSRRTVDGLEINREVEFEIAGGATEVAGFAEALGFPLRLTKRKRSEVFRVGQVRAELNHVAELGWFLELEVLSEREAEAEAIRQRLLGLIHDLGLDPAAIEEQPYILMLARRRAKR